MPVFLCDISVGILQRRWYTTRNFLTYFSDTVIYHMLSTNALLWRPWMFAVMCSVCTYQCALIQTDLSVQRTVPAISHPPGYIEGWCAQLNTFQRMLNVL